MQIVMIGPFGMRSREAVSVRTLPVPLTVDMVDEYMGPVLEAARDGDLSLIKNVEA
jgi:alcohol dehydrogenase